MSALHSLNLSAPAVGLWSHSAVVSEATTRDPGVTDGDYMTYEELLEQLLSIPQEHLLPRALPSWWRWCALFLYAAIFVLAVGGNLLVVLVIALHPVLQTVTNRFLLSLAVSDLCITLLNLPCSLLLYLTNQWLLGDFLCKFSSYLQGVFIVSTIFTLTVLAVDRYYAILYPLKARHIHTPTRAVVVIAAIWVTSLVLLSPQAAINRLEPFLHVPDNKSQLQIVFMCGEYFSSTQLKISYSVTIFMLLYVIPVVVMVSTYGAIVRHLRSRKPIGECPVGRAVGGRERVLSENRAILRMLVVIVMCFIMAWMPFFACQVVMLGNFHLEMPLLLLSVVHIFGYSNACVNPIIYCFLNDKFRACALALLSGRCFRSRDRGVMYSSKRFSVSRSSTKVVVYSEHTTV